MFKRMISLAILASAAVACSASTTENATAGAAADLTSSSWLQVVDPCVQTALGAAAVKAFDDEPSFQHLYGLSVDGDLAVDGDLKITVTTGNAEDGDTDRVILVNQKIDTSTGKSTCTVSKIDGKAPGDLSKSKASFDRLVDPCFQNAVVAAQKISNNYWHLQDMKAEGDLAQTGEVKYTITQSNDEDGDTSFAVATKLTVDVNTGKETCKVTSSKELPRN